MTGQLDHFASRVDADAFEAALNGATPSPDMAALVGTARRVGGVHLPQPDPAFVASLASQLRAEAAGMPAHAPSSTAAAATPARVVSIHRAWPKVLAGAAAGVLVAGTGAAAASQHALPGEALYPVRGVVDSVEVGLSGGEAARGRTHLAQAREHIQDTETLLDRGSEVENIRTSLRDAAASVQSGNADLFQAYDADHQATDLAAVQDFTTWATPRVEALRSRMPADALGELAALQQQVAAGSTTLRARLASCGQACAAISPTSIPAVTPTASAGSTSAVAADPAPGATSAMALPTDARTSDAAPLPVPLPAETHDTGQGTVPALPPLVPDRPVGPVRPPWTTPPTSPWTAAPTPARRPSTSTPRRPSSTPRPDRTTRPAPSSTAPVTRTPEPTPTTIACPQGTVPNANGTRCVPRKRRPTPPPPTPDLPTVTAVPLPSGFPSPTITVVVPVPTVAPTVVPTVAPPTVTATVTAIPTSATGGVGPTPTPTRTATPEPTATRTVTPEPDGRVVTPLAPTFAERCTPGRRSVRIPLVRGVGYRWSQTMHGGTQHVEVDAFARPGYVLADGAQTHWEHTFTDCHERD